MHFAIFVVDSWRIYPYNLGMAYTTKQLKTFAEFCARHEIRFGSVVEYHSALKQFFSNP